MNESASNLNPAQEQPLTKISSIIYDVDERRRRCSGWPSRFNILWWRLPQ
jgi:hypothetical protein